MARKLNVNTATAPQLAAVPGLSADLAVRIVEHRARVGPFRVLEELAAVSGIDAALVERLRPHLATEDESTAPAPPERPPHLLRLTLRNEEALPYTGHRVAAAFARRPRDADTAEAPAMENVPGLLEQALPSAGQTTLAFPHREELAGEVVLSVRAPDGALLREERLPAQRLPEALQLDVVPVRYAEPAPNTDPGFGKPRRLKGRVIDEAGQRQVARRQVVVWAVDVESPEPADFRALIATDTDDHGYFGGPYPVGRFGAAQGTVALGGGERASVPIHLQDDGSFPESVILVVTLPPPVGLPEDCDCRGADVPRDPDAADLGRADGTYSSDPGAGRCVDFTKPDRTLEEYTFAYVVRTTEPVVKGLTLQEPTKIDVSRLRGLLAPLVAGASASIARESTSDALAAAAPLDARLDAAASRIALGRAAASSAVGAAAAELEAAHATGAEAGRAAATMPRLATEHIDARVLRSLAADPEAFSLEKVAAAAQLTLHADLIRVLDQRLAQEPGRTPLDCRRSIDWDHEPTLYQACTIAHGHVLRFKQEWVADGYSMGNLLYSLPLAPGQKKQIAVVDWERRETAARTEELVSREALEAEISRDRDINEIVSGTVNESVRGGSRSTTGSIAGGFGAPVLGGLLGVGGGASSAVSSAWQDSSRNTAASALNQLRDRTIQTASALRSQRSTVVQTVSQGERVVATTETVANYNHCHAITIQYFEVLRHLLVRQRLVDVQECLFVPLLMSRFDRDKALRWRSTLAPAVPPRLRPGFDALERMRNNYVGSDLPVGTYADQALEHLEGHLYLRFELARPRDADDDFDANAWTFVTRLFPTLSAADFYRQHLRGQALKDRIFQEQLAPRIAERFVQHLRFFAVDLNGQRIRLPVDTTLVSDYAPERPLYVSLRLSAALPALARRAVRSLEISDVSGLSPLPLFQLLPADSKVIVTTGTASYRTRYSSGHLFRDAQVMNDLLGGDVVRIDCPLSREELRNPREEDKELSRQLLAHLNEHLEPMHHRVWGNTSRDRLFMLLDGFEAPNAGGRSVASVVQLELIGIVGNSLILPVAPGFHLDPTFRQDIENPIDLLEHYQPNTPIEPSRIAIPTRGVYAEAVMGACNSCERKEEERFWRWEESPLPDQPPPILPVSTETRRAEPPDLTAKDFPAPIVAMQNAPAAPDPTGLAAAMQLLGTAGLFKDITGLEGTQRNAAAALQSAFSTAQFFGGKAADLALQQKMSRDIDKAMRTIATAKQSGLLTEQQSQELTRNAISGMIGGGPEEKSKSLATADEVRKIADSAAANKADIAVKRPDGETVEARTLPQAIKPGAATEVVLDGNTPAARTFHPEKGDKSGRTQLRAVVSGAPPGARFAWTAQHPDKLRFDQPQAGATDVLAGESGVTSVSFEVRDPQGNSLRVAHIEVGVPLFVQVSEYAGAAYASHRTGLADPHRFATVLADFGLTGQRDAVLQTAKLVAEFLLRQANVRLIWGLAPVADALPAQFQAGAFAAGFLIPLSIAGFAPTSRFGNAQATGTLGLTNTTRAGDILPTTGVIEVYPGGLDSNVFPQVTRLRAEVRRLIDAVAADPADAAAAQELARLQDVWAEVIGRVTGLTIAHEVHHMMLANAPGLTGGHTTAPEIDLLSPGSALDFKQWSGIETPSPLPATFPAAGTFTDRGFNGLAVIGEANQGRVDALFPVPPAFPF